MTPNDWSRVVRSFPSIWRRPFSDMLTGSITENLFSRLAEASVVLRASPSYSTHRLIPSTHMHGACRRRTRRSLED